MKNRFLNTLMVSNNNFFFQNTLNEANLIKKKHNPCIKKVRYSQYHSIVEEDLNIQAWSLVEIHTNTRSATKKICKLTNANDKKFKCT
jgi:hypothetical protein